MKLGLFGINMSPDKTSAARARLRQAQEEYDRPSGLGEPEISITPPHRISLDAALVRRYADLGVTRLILLAPGAAHEHKDELLAFIDEAPRSLLA